MVIVMNLQEKQDLITAKIKECLVVYGLQDIDLVIDFMPLGSTGGLAYFLENIYNTRYFIVFNSVMIDQSFELFHPSIPIHECAHIIQVCIAPEAKQAHGPEWRAIVRRLGSEPTTYHELPIEGLGRSKSRIMKVRYQCGCSKYSLSITEHNKIRSGKKSKYCETCRFPAYAVDYI